MQQEELKRVLLRQEVEISDMREALMRAEYMLKFVEDSYQFSKDQVLHGDYYMMFEGNCTVMTFYCFSDTAYSQIGTAEGSLRHRDLCATSCGQGRVER